MNFKVEVAGICYHKTDCLWHSISIDFNLDLHILKLVAILATHLCCPSGSVGIHALPKMIKPNPNRHIKHALGATPAATPT